jgi:hypothetical protein
VVQSWFSSCGINLGPVLTDPQLKSQVIRLLYTYRDINATELAHIPATDLYEHKVRLKPGTRPWKSSRKKRMTHNQQYWLNKILTEGMACTMYESTAHANGELSPWNAEAVVVPKPGAEELPLLLNKEESKGPEMRITFNYSHVEEDMPGTFLQLTSEVHDYLSDPHHSCFMQYDIKHAYWSIGIYPPH